jgi:hypothetical protein
MSILFSLLEFGFVVILMILQSTIFIAITCTIIALRVLASLIGLRRKPERRGRW